MWRTLDAQLRTLQVRTLLGSSTFNFSACSSFCTIFTQSTKHNSHPQLLQPKPLQAPFYLPEVHVCFAATTVKTYPLGFNFGVFALRCVSSVSSAPTLDWNEAVSCSEVGDGNGGSVEEDTKPSIPVRAYFFSTR